MSLIRKSWYWMREVILDDAYPAIAVGFCGITIFFSILIPIVDPNESDKFSRMAGFIPLFMSAIYGGIRVNQKHPALNKDYRNWLLQTPWTFRHPLPLGPVRLKLQDAIIVIAFMVVCLFLASEFVWWVPVVFLFGFLSSLATAMMVSNLWTCYYCLNFAVVAMCFFHTNPLISGSIGIAAYIFGYTGLKHSLKQLRDISESIPENIRYSFSGDAKLEKRYENYPGWPFDALKPYGPKWSLAPFHGIMLSILAGCWTFVILTISNSIVMTFAPELDPDLIYQPFNQFQFESQKSIGEAADLNTAISSICNLTYLATYGLGLVLIFFCVLQRLISYIDGCYFPPINFLGRISTRQWIIPEYDVVFLAPVATLLAGILVPAFGIWIGLNALYVVPIAITSMFLILLVAGPDLEKWQLTAPCRMINMRSKSGRSRDQNATS